MALECALPLVEELYLAQNANLADLDAVAADAKAGIDSRRTRRGPRGFACADLSDALSSWARQVALFARLGAARAATTDNRLECVELLAPQLRKPQKLRQTSSRRRARALRWQPNRGLGLVDALARLARLGSLRLGAPVTRGLGASEVRVA